MVLIMAFVNFNFKLSTNQVQSIGEVGKRYGSPEAIFVFMDISLF